MKSAAICLLSAVVLSACGVKKTAAPELGDLSFSAYSSCYSGADERNSPAHSGVVDSGYFGKLIDEGDLSSILTTDIPSTATHASHEKLALYVVNQGTDSCTAFSFLPPPNEHIYGYWAEASGELGSNSLLGLYKEDCNDSCEPNQVINPLVLLNACTDRWTMVHEMLHHNFNVQRKKFKPFDADEAVVASLQNELAVLQQTVEGYNSTPSEYQGMQLVHSLDRVRDLMIRFVYQTSFEEITVESILMKRYVNGELMNVPRGAVKNSINYIRYSAGAGTDRLAPIKAATDDLRNSARQSGWNRVVTNAAILHSKIETFEDDVSCYVDEAEAMYRRATTDIYPGNIEWSNGETLRLQSAVAAHVQSHESKLSEVDQKLRDVLQQLKPKAKVISHHARAQ